MATVVEPKKAVKKTKPAAVDQAIQQLADLGVTRRRIPLSALRRHPDNRVPSEAAIGDVAASMDSLGQIEPAIVRPLFGDTWQVISGETRWRAAERLGWAALDCEVREYTDAEALQALAAANASRQDLTAIDKAKLIVRLCESKSTGGGGLSREAAAAMFELQSAGAASNLVRLLELPDVWQQRVASGELPQTFGRELLRLVPLDAGVWVDLEKEWGDRHETDSTEIKEWSAFHSRAELEGAVDSLVNEWTRVVEKGDRQHCDAWQVDGAEYFHPLRFKLTPNLEEELRIIDVTLDGNTKRRATNVTLYDSFQVPAIKAHVAKCRAKNGGGRDSDRDEEPAEKLTPAQQAAEEKRKRAEAAEKLERRINAWRTEWMRELCAIALMEDEHHDLAVRLCMWLQSHVRNVSYKNYEDLAIDHFLKDLWNGKKDSWSAALAGNKRPGAAEFVAHWLRVPNRDGHLHPFGDRNVLDLSARLRIDLVDAWGVMQAGQKTPERFRAFFEIHNSEQLDELGRELGVHVVGATKEAKVRLFTSRDRTLPLPKSLRLKELTGKAGA